MNYLAFLTVNPITSLPSHLDEVQQSRNRPGVAQSVPGGLDSQIFMTFGA